MYLYLNRQNTLYMFKDNERNQRKSIDIKLALYNLLRVLVYGWICTYWVRSHLLLPPDVAALAASGATFSTSGPSTRFRSKPPLQQTIPKDDARDGLTRQLNPVGLSIETRSADS